MRDDDTAAPAQAGDNALTRPGNFADVVTGTGRIRADHHLFYAQAFKRAQAHLAGLMPPGSTARERDVVGAHYVYPAQHTQ